MKQEIFQRRRKEFMAKMNGGVAVFGSAPVRLRNGDVDFEYRQDSDFFYLTGFEEPDAVCVLAPGNPKYEYALFVRPRDKDKESWNGYRAGVEGAMQDYRAEIAYTPDKLEESLAEFLYNAPTLYYSLNRYPEWDHRIFGVIDKVKELHRQGIYPPSAIVDPATILADMRLYKKADELEVLQHAVEISAQAHLSGMKATTPMKYEYEVQAVVEYAFRSKGSMRNGYPSIVGSGPNSCILHYINNNRQMQPGDLLLIDAGAEFDYYTGDITRTFPVSGKFTAPQRAVYELVLDAQQKAIADVKPGNTIMQVHEMTVRNLTEGMISLGLLSGGVDENIQEEHYKKYYMHRTSHWLGIDVHDAGRYKSQDKWRVLEPGMVLTIEPGIYIAPDDEHEAFRSIGIRIEDDVLVTAEGPRVLSASCPKQVAELESLIGQGN
jgi:Xaa-Pro aminopeptidase